MERRGFGILQKERDVADAQAAILKQGAREITIARHRESGGMTRAPRPDGGSASAG